MGVSKIKKSTCLTPSWLFSQVADFQTLQQGVVECYSPCLSDFCLRFCQGWWCKFAKAYSLLHGVSKICLHCHMDWYPLPLQKVIYLKYYKHSNQSCTFAVLGLLGCPGRTESFCHFAKVSQILVWFLHIFISMLK